MRSVFNRYTVGSAAVLLFLGTAVQGFASEDAHDKAAHGYGVRPANPYLAYVPDPSTVDWAYWSSHIAAKSKARADKTTAKQRAAAGRALPAPLLHDELEPAGDVGSNDAQNAAEQVVNFGTDPKLNPRVRIVGELADPAPNPKKLPPGDEDNGSIPLATDTGIGDSVKAISTTGVLGAGPHGPDGDGSNDFDFYSVQASAGETIIASTAGSEVDTIAVVYNSAGEQMAINDDASPLFDGTSRVTYDVSESGTYYVLIVGHAPNPLPEDPNDSGSGTGKAITGEYKLTISSSKLDQDFYAVKLREGDVLGASVKGAAHRLVVHHVDGEQRHGSDHDLSAMYPPTSPLPGGGNAVVAYVAEEPGWYAVSVEDGSGKYDATVEVYRPGTETDEKPQTIFLDFDGARVNTAMWEGPGVVDLSPFSSFIAKWGLPRSAEDELIDRIVATVTENVRDNLAAQGLNRNVDVRILNSRDHADPYGKENVSRVVFGGTRAESGLETIGIAQHIDPGNFGHEDTAVVLMDMFTEPAGPAWSLNTYLKPESDRVAFIAQVVGNMASHEIGHLMGNYHVDHLNDVPNLMDQGGNMPMMYGVGPDNIGGTADDVDIRFGPDHYSSTERFTGIQNTLNVSAWGVTKPRG